MFGYYYIKGLSFLYITKLFYTIFNKANLTKKEKCVILGKVLSKNEYNKIRRRKIVNTLKIKQVSSLWIPQGIFYATDIKKNENKT